MSIPSFHLPGPIGDAVDSVRNAATDAASTIRSDAKSAADTVRGAVTTVQNDVRSGLADASGRIADAATSIQQQIAAATPNPELDSVMADVRALRDRLHADPNPSEQEIQDLRTAIGRAAARLAEIAGPGGGPTRELDEAKELRAIHFEYLEGKGGVNGALAALVNAPASERAARARDVALDIAASADGQTAKDKVNLLRASLSRVPDSALQESCLDAVEAGLRTAPPGAIAAARFHELAHVRDTVAVHKTPLPASVAGTDAAFPNRPVPGWEDEARRSVAAGFDDLHAKGDLFIDKAQKPAGRPLEVAVKIDLNLGMQGPPTVSDPAHTFATIVELGERAKARGMPTHFTVGDSSGAENLGTGVTSLDIAKRTGNYHEALKAGLTLAAGEGDRNATVELDRLKQAEAAGYYAGGPGDPHPESWGPAEHAASKFVTVVDFDKTGWKDVPNNLGPLGRSLYAWDHFSIAKPWADADARVHVTRSPSDHALLEKGKNHSMTGATKGLIGLQAIDRRPAWYGFQLSGVDFAMAPFAIARGASFAEVVGARLGASIPALLAGNLPDDVKTPSSAAENSWNALKNTGAPFREFQVRMGGLEQEVKAARAGGATDRDVIERERAGIRTILQDLDRKNQGLNPPFSQQFQSASSEMTRLGETLIGYERYLNALPPSPGREFRGEDMARRIGLLTALPDPSDLVVTGDVKRGIVGGPDAYRHCLDVGETYVSTSEAAVDAAASARTTQILDQAEQSGAGGMIAWAAERNSKNPWDSNVTNGALQFGHAPMGPQEMDLVGDTGDLRTQFASWNR